MISSIFGTRFNHKKHVKSSSCSRPPISTTRIRLRVCTKLHSKTLPLEKKRKNTVATFPCCSQGMLHEQTPVLQKGTVFGRLPLQDPALRLADNLELLVSGSWNPISHPASFSEVADVLPRTPRWLGVGSKMKNMSARPYNPVHCTWQGQRNKFSWLSLLQRCASKLNLGMGHEAIKFEMIRSFSPTSGGLCIFGPIHSWVLPVVVVITWSAQQGEGHGRMDHIWEPQYQAVPSVPRTILRWAVLPARCLELMLYAPRKQSYNSFKDFYEAGLSWLGLKRSRKGGKFRRVVRTLISRTSCSCAFTCAWFIQPIIPLLP